MDDSMFRDIRPYNDDEIPSAMQRIADARQLRPLMSFLFPDMPIDGVRNFLKSINTIDEFQQKMSIPAFRTVLEDTTTSLSFHGFENISKQTPYLFVSNHRDITLDTVLLQLALLDHGFPTTIICVGDNLMQDQYLTDIWRSNKMAKVIRGGAIRESLQNSQQLSQYIRYVIKEKKESIWIAQRNGRTKDGNDRTDPALIKMFAMSGGDDIVENIAELNIVPMAISYQIEPCDWMKTKELLLSRTDTYVKASNEDFQSIITGVMQKKGDVNLRLMPPINERLRSEKFEDISCVNDYFKYIAKIVDDSIHEGYHLFDTNYISHDLLHRSRRYEEFYTSKARSNFIVDMNEKIAKIGHGSYEEIREIFLGIYANPVDSKGN